MRQQVVTHHLEMTDPSQLVPARTSAPTFSLCQAEIPCPALNRFLYTAVGGDWYWTQRLAWSYAQWQTYLAQAGVETWVAYVAGTPAGYFELETQAEGNIEIAYLGLLPQFIGHGLGGALLTATVERAWARGGSGSIRIRSITRTPCPVTRRAASGCSRECTPKRSSPRGHQGRGLGRLRPYPEVLKFGAFLPISALSTPCACTGMTQTTAPPISCLRN